VSLSYIWMVSVLNIFTEDIYQLINSVKSDYYNLRNDFSEVTPFPIHFLFFIFICFTVVGQIEPVSATCLLRILLRYIVEIEGIDYTSLSKIQQECFHSTIEAVVFFLIPSMQKLMEDYFLIERLSLLSNPPSVIQHDFLSLSRSPFNCFLFVSLPSVFLDCLQDGDYATV